MPIVTIQTATPISCCASCDGIVIGTATVIVFPCGRVEDYCDACYHAILSWR